MRSITLEPTVHAPRIARRFAVEAVRHDVVADLDALGVLVSELVHLALVPACTWVHVSLEPQRRVLHVEVSDGSDDPLMPGDVVERLLDHLADRWGVEERVHGKAVWFELRRATARGLGRPALPALSPLW